MSTPILVGLIVIGGTYSMLGFIFFMKHLENKERQREREHPSH
ncbi:hypothetical protein [Acidihalobacter yilgarnensis]|nr:hypothetical protein [Acidihalobacter yilgarnensis]